VSDEAQVHFPFFPLAVAAAALGMPAVSFLTVEILTADPGTTRFQLSCLVLKEILGEELALVHVAQVATKDARLGDGPRREQVSRFVRLPVNDWQATFCSDFSAK
jgi:hypothetical protein